MKRASIVLTMVLVLSAAAFVWAKSDSKGGCGSCGKDTPATQPAKPINTVCPVEGGKVKPGLTIVYQGKTIGFCCPDCIPEFKKDPEKYMKNIK